MPFNPTGSVISTDLDNMLRGLYRDNSDRVITGVITEQPMAGFNISPNVIGPTGALYVVAAGTSSGAGGTKTVALWFGSVQLAALVVPSGLQSWLIKAWIYNTALNAQRVLVECASIPGAPGTLAAPVLTYAYFATAVDTSQNQTLGTRTTNANAGDTCTNTIFDVFVVQIN